MNAIAHRDYVLLVEDEDQVSKMLTAGRNDAYEISRSGTLAEAIASARDRKPDAIILDLNLPCSKGAMTYIRMHAACPDIPIVLFTGQSDKDIPLILAPNSCCVDKGTNGAMEIVWKNVRQKIDDSKPVMDAAERVGD